MRSNRIIMNVIISSLIGISLSMLIKSFVAAKEVQSNTIFVAELAENVLPNQIITAESLIRDMPQVKGNTVSVISAAQALDKMKNEMPELAYMADNPFRNIITFQTRGVLSKELADFKIQLMEIGGIEDLYFDKDLMAALPKSISKVRLGGILVSLVLLIGALSALILRIKRDIRAYEKDMKIMSLAGAEDDRISKLRVFWSTKWGAISAGFAGVISMIYIIFINNTLLDGLEITFLQGVFAILVMMIVVIGAHALVTHQATKAYLNRINPSIRA